MIKRNLKYILLALFIIASTHKVVSQSYKKAFKLFNASKFVDARNKFNSILDDSPEDAVAYFGLAKVYSNPKFPEKDFFKAFKYINDSKQFINNLSAKHKKQLINYIFDFNNAIQIAEYEIEDSLLQFVLKSNNLKVTKKFLSECSSSKFFETVVMLYHKLEYDESVKINKIGTYNHFIEKFPLAVQVEKVINLRDKLIFDSICKVNIIYVFNEFIMRYPTSIFLDSAIQLRNRNAYELALQSFTVEDFNSFIIKYPTAKQFNEVINLRTKKFFDFACNSRTIDKIQEFIYYYPNSEYIDEAILERDSLVFVQIRRMTDETAFNQFINNYPFAKEAMKEFINDYSAYINNNKQRKKKI